MAIVSTDSTYTFTVTSNRSLTAVFEAIAPSYTITILIDPAAAGTVTGAGTYEEGQAATLTYTAADGYNFSGWYSGGTLLSTSNPYSFQPTSSMTITAKAAQIPVYTITATIDPSGSGTVTGAGQYQGGATVTLVATAGDGYEFSGWQEGGQTVSTGATYTFTATADRVLVAAFAVASRLPGGYTELEYIESSGTQYINTEVVPTATMKIDLDFDILSLANNDTFFGCYSMAGTKYVQFRAIYAGTTIGLRLLYGGNSSMYAENVDFSTSVGRHTLELNALEKTCAFDGTQKTIGVNYDPPFSADILLFASNSAGTYNCRCSMRLYSCRIWNNRNLVRDYIPCKNPSGKVGLYDTVAKGFNAGSENFIAGPAV